MKRDLVINIVLIVVGVVLAFVLFAAGVRWQVNGILSVRSGQRYSVIDGSGDPANTGNQGWAGYEQVQFGRRPEFGLVFERGASVHAKLLD